MTSNKRLEFTLLGTGSSGGVPRIGNDWGACDPSEQKNRRLRCSALAELFDISDPTERTRVLIDTSPDLRQQLLSAGIDRLDGVLITHDHADQTHGLDDVRALAIRERKPLDIYMDEATSSSLTNKFNYCFKGGGGYPPILNQKPYMIYGEDFSVNGPAGSLSLLPLKQVHGQISSVGFRIGNLAYCNDVSELPDETLERLTNLDVLIVDALRYTPHPTHAHLAQTLQWVLLLKPKQTILTNLHIDMDYGTLKQELPKSVVPGFDGMKVQIAISHNGDYAT